MTKYIVKLTEEDLQMIKDCHSKNPSIMKAMAEAKKEDQFQTSLKGMPMSIPFLFIDLILNQHDQDQADRQLERFHVLQSPGSQLKLASVDFLSQCQHGNFLGSEHSRD